MGGGGGNELRREVRKEIRKKRSGEERKKE